MSPQQMQLVWILLALLVGCAATIVVRRRRRHPPEVADPFAPALYLRTADPDVHVRPEVIHMPARGKLRIGYHPAHMDPHVGSSEFTSLPAIDVRGDPEAVRELSRHAACVWRDRKTGACYVQLGWTGPGEPIKPRSQSRVIRFGRPQDAASQPFKLAHRDVLRLSSSIEYVFVEVEALRDRATPEQKKIDAFEASAPSSSAKLSLLRPGQTRPVRSGSPADDDDLA